VYSPSIELTARLTALVIDRLGKPLKPKAIEFVRDLPKTRNAKVMRRVIRAVYLGDEPGDLSSLENPQAVEDVRSIAPSRTVNGHDV
jgi:acetyl-CoA synthetase